MTATGVEAQIGEALFARLAALTLSPVLLVAYPNAVFPPAGSDKPTTYLKASLLRVGAQGIGISAWDEHAGILQVDVLSGSQSGEVKPLQIADAVAAWFGRGTRLTNGSVQVDVYETPRIGPAIADDGNGYEQIPVSVRYRTFVR
jgi:hypothetical protein